MNSLPIELLLEIDDRLDDPARIAFRLACKSLLNQLPAFKIDLRVYNSSLCFRSLINAHLSDTQDSSTCRICSHRYSRDEMFTASTLMMGSQNPPSAQQQERIIIERDFILRHGCGRDGGPGTVPTCGSDICDWERHRFVQMERINDSNQPKQEDVQWTIRDQKMCLHCFNIMPLFRQTCSSCQCRLCGVRRAKILVRTGSDSPDRYAIYQEVDGSFWVAEWREGGLRKIQVLHV